MIELWHEWNSVHSFKVRIVLAEKRLAWSDHTVELLRFEHLLPEYLKLNPDGVVPTLVHDGRAVFDSSIICEYLDEVFPDPPLKPANLVARAAMRRWPKYHDEIVHAALRNASFQLLYKPYLAAIPREELIERLRCHPHPDRTQKFLDAATMAIDGRVVRESIMSYEQIAKRIDAALGEHDWLSGDCFSLADVAMAPFAERIENLNMAFVWGGCARGAAWSRQILERPSIAGSRAPERYRLPQPPTTRSWNFAKESQNEHSSRE